MSRSHLIALSFLALVAIGALGVFLLGGSTDKPTAAASGARGNQTGAFSSVMMREEKRQRIATPSAENVFWPLVSLNGEPVEADVIKVGMIMLKSAKRVQGHAGCNTFSGTYALKDDALDYSAIAAGKTACERMEAEQAFLKAMADTASWKVEGDTLLLMNKSGKIIAELGQPRQ